MGAQPQGSRRDGSDIGGPVEPPPPAYPSGLSPVPTPQPVSYAIAQAPIEMQTFPGGPPGGVYMTMNAPGFVPGQPYYMPSQPVPIHAAHGPPMMPPNIMYNTGTALPQPQVIMIQQTPQADNKQPVIINNTQQSHHVATAAVAGGAGGCGACFGASCGACLACLVCCTVM